MIKGLLIGFGFLVVMTQIALGLVRHADGLTTWPGRRAAAEAKERDGY